MKKLILIRHGRSFYKDVFPDLTEDGVMDAKNAASRISKITLGKRVKIISSPSPRAMGTATILGENIFYKGEAIKYLGETNNLIRPMDKYDKDAVTRFWNCFPSYAEAEKDFMTNPLFADGSIAEKRSTILKRLLLFLTKTCSDLALDENTDVLIAVSHTEILSWIPFNYGIKQPLTYCEEIIINFDENLKISPVFRFRGKVFRQPL